MKIFVKTLLFTTIIILTLYIRGALERILHIGAGILLYIIFKEIKSKKFKDYKKIGLGILLGYFTGCILLLIGQYRIVDMEFNKNYMVQDKIGIILLFNAEPLTYQPSILIKNFKDANPLLDLYKLPLNLYKNKIFLEHMEDNMNRDYSSIICEAIQKQVGSQYTVYTGYTHKSPYLEETIKESINQGDTKLIIIPVSLTELNKIEIYPIIQQTQLENKNIKLDFTNYLWDSELIARSYVDRINNNIKVSDKESVGILLLGEVYKEDKANETYIKQDLLFRGKVKDLLKEEGYDGNKIRLCFFNRKLINKEIENLMVYGVKQIVIVHTSEESKRNSSLAMVGNLLKPLEKNQSPKLTQICGWIPDEYLIKELLKRIELARFTVIES